MNNITDRKNLRILIVDDNRAIHEDFRKILSGKCAGAIEVADRALFGEPGSAPSRPQYELDSAYEGMGGLELVRQAVEAGHPYAMAFVDMRMPPGWDGIETIERIWKICPDLQVVVCTAYSEYSQDEMVHRLGRSDGWLILKKPHDNIEVLQLAAALTEKWQLIQETRAKVDELEWAVKLRTGQQQAAMEHLTKSLAEQGRSESALRESEERFRTLSACSPVGILLIDAAGRCLYCNARWLAISGLTIDESLGDRWSQALFPEDRTAVLAEWNKKPAMAGRFTDELRLRHPDGKPHWVYIQSSAIKSDASAPTGRVATVEDITDRTQAEKAVEESRQRLTSIINSVEGIVWEANAQTFRFTFVSEKAEQILGFPVAQWISEPNFWQARLHPSDRAAAIAVFDDAIHELRPRQFEYRMLAADGREVSIRHIITVIHEQGRAVTLRGIMMDITEQKRMEDQLRQSQKMDAIGQLAGGIAHDFNNILTVINGFSDMLVTSADFSSESVEGLKQISAAGQRAASLTRRLLAVSRKQAVQMEVIDLNGIVTAMAKMLRRLVSEDIVLQLNISAGPATGLMDTGMIEQVLLNLVVNARDSMPKGGRLTIETEVKEMTELYLRHRPEARPGRFVTLSVRDTGCGITPEVQSHMFEPFFTTKPVGTGVGLGLATVFGIVKQHQGWIDVESTVNQGTIFTLFLPSNSGAADGSVAKTSPKPAVGGNELVLLVEDEDAVRLLAGIVLKKYGYRIFEASSGSEALKVWEQHAAAIDVLITDMVMPGDVSGRELAEQLQASKPGLKVIFTSGYSAEMMGESFGPHATTPFLQKPYLPSQLAAVLRACLETR